MQLEAKEERRRGLQSAAKKGRPCCWTMQIKIYDEVIIIHKTINKLLREDRHQHRQMKEEEGRDTGS